MKIRRALLLSVAAIAVIANVGCAKARGHFDQTLTTSAAPHVTIHCPTGSIVLRSGAPGTIAVSADFTIKSIFASRLARQWEEHPPIVQTGNMITIGNGTISSGIFRKLRFHYWIVVPSDADVATNMGEGPQDLAGLRAHLRAETGAGETTLSDFSGEGDIRMGVGNLEASNFSGQLRVRTGTGNLRVVANQLHSGVLELGTGAGNIEIQNLNGGLRARTGAGFTRISGTPSANWSIESGSGSVELDFSEKSAFKFAAEAPVGCVTLNRTLENVITNGQGRTNSINGRVSGTANGGGPSVKVKVGAGKIVVN